MTVSLDGGCGGGDFRLHQILLPHLFQQDVALPGENLVDAFVVPAPHILDELAQLGQILDSLGGLLADLGRSAFENEAADGREIARLDGRLQLSFFLGRDEGTIGAVRRRTRRLEAFGRIYGR